MKRKLRNNTVKLTKMAMLIAISIGLVSLVHFPIFPSVPFLEYDPADIPIIIGTFAFGQIEGVIITLVTAVIQGSTVSANSGPYGIIMHILATGSYVLAAGAVYGFSKTKKNAIKAMIAGTLVMTTVMMCANMIVTPIFTGVPVAAVAQMLPMIGAFNIIKAGGNSIVTFFVYKKISRFLHADMES
ncbi:MAG: ECF transporter S component [Eubacteriales bacterium]